MADPIAQLNSIFSRLSDVMRQAINRDLMQSTAKYMIDLIISRTREGYGVPRNYGNETSLKPLSSRYIEYRSKSKNLSPLTSPSKSNLTFTGQMVGSLGIKSITTSGDESKIIISPLGSRKDSNKTNAEIADYQEQKGRIFNRFSKGEQEQMANFYRRSFHDLLKKKKLIS